MKRTNHRNAFRRTVAWMALITGFGGIIFSVAAGAAWIQVPNVPEPMLAMGLLFGVLAVALGIETLRSRY